jgi:hypothetical protein
MNKWIIKLFGINKLNFFGWIFAGLIIITASFGCFLMALFRMHSLDDLTPQFFLLLGILVVLFGQFSLNLQLYHAKLAEKLSTKEEKEADNRVEHISKGSNTSL